MSPRGIISYNGTMKGRVIVTIVVLSVYLVGVTLLVQDYQRQQRARIEQGLVRLQSRLDATVQSLGYLARYAVSGIVTDTPAASIMAAVADADDADREVLRRELFEVIDPIYRRMQDYHFRQVHFHLPDTTSFLRMHNPDRFGDPLADVRPTVRIANREHREVNAFEEGRILNGYRYVFPVDFEGAHVGSVEASFSMNRFIENLTGFTGSSYLFAMERSVVEETVFDDKQSNYRSSGFSPDLMLDRNVTHQVDELQLLLEHKDVLEPGIAGSRDFGVFLQNGTTPVMILFASIRNINDDHVAYIIELTEDATKATLREHLIQALFVITVAALLVEVLSWQVFRERTRLKAVARTDQLTGIMNRRALREHLDRELALCGRYGTELSVLLFDIDHFKEFNDRYGHAEGDRVLVTVATGVAGILRSVDYVARWGGEEFIAVLPNTGIDGGYDTAEKIRLHLCTPEGSGGRELTVSIGVAQYVPGESIELCIARADEALYRAKRSGRNRTCRAVADTAG